jgi:hypothetical protein
MLTRKRFEDLHSELIDTPVLSVYIDGGEADQTKRGEWSQRLAAATQGALEQANGSGANGSTDLRSAIDTLEAELKAQGGVKLAQGWVGFIADSTLRYGEAQPMRLPTAVQWQRGMLLSPYLPVLELNPPVVVALLDRERSRILTYQKANLSETATLTVDRTLDDLSDIGVMKSAHATTGVRGATGRDTAQRSLKSESERLLQVTRDAVTEAAVPDGGIIIGGTAEAAAILQSRLPEPLRDQSVLGSGLTIEMSDPEILESLDTLMPEVRSRRYARMLDGIIESSHDGGKGALGWNATLEAIKSNAADTLLVSREFIDNRTADAEELVGPALLHGTHVALLEGASGERLEDVGDGVGARLRFSRQD